MGGVFCDYLVFEYMIEIGIVCIEIVVYVKIGYNFMEEVLVQVFLLGGIFWQVEFVWQVVFCKLCQLVIDFDQVIVYCDVVVVLVGKVFDVVVFFVGIYVEQCFEVVMGYVFFNGFFFVKQNECGIF